MVYAFTQDVPIDEPTYRKIMDRLGPEPLKGLLLHLAVRRPDRGLRYIDVWESEESCEKRIQRSNPSRRVRRVQGARTSP